MIYATPFRGHGADAETTGPSTPSGFETLEEVVAACGPDYTQTHPRIITYGEGKNRVAFSDIIFRIDAAETNG